MSLINLKTDLKSLKYGLDRPNLGSSKEPFITKSIPDERLIGTSDFILRDGALRRGAEDVSRLTKLFTTFNGLRFITNTNLLAAQNPRVPGDPKNIYSPLNTLAQVGVNAIGTHLNLLGVTPFDVPSVNINLGNISFSLGGDKYGTLYKNSYSQPNSNRLVLLQKSKIGSAFINNTPPPPPSTPSSSPNSSQTPFLGDIGTLTSAIDIFGPQAFGQGFISSISNVLNPSLTVAEAFKAKDYGVAVLDNDLILNYAGGPGAGITGLKTKIKRSTYTIGSEGYISPAPIEGGQNPKNLRTYQVGRKSITYGKDVKAGEINATRYLGTSNLYPGVVKGISEDGDPSGITFGVKYGQGLVSSPSQIYPTYTDVSQSREFISEPLFEPYKYGLPTNNGSYSDDKFSRDKTRELHKKLANAEGGYANVSNTPPEGQLFKFYLNLIEADTPGTDQYLYWQAYVDSFSDSINANYSEYSYVGRGYPFYRYDGFGRNINLSFTIVTPEVGQMLVIYKRLNRLIRSLAPNYSDEGYLRGNFVKLTFGDYLNNVPGILKGFTLNPIFDAGFETEITGMQLPIAIKVDGFNFVPIAADENKIIDLDSNFISLPADPTP
jgi:hypothetical protein